MVVLSNEIVRIDKNETKLLLKDEEPEVMVIFKIDCSDPELDLNHINRREIRDKIKKLYVN